MNSNLIVDGVDWTSISERVRIQQKNREIYTPSVSLFRWWARRSHGLIGAIIDAAISRERSSNILVSDPLSGGGTVVIEAAMRGCSIYAQDLHPWAAWGLATALDGADPNELEQATSQLLESTQALRADAYGSNCESHGKSEILHAFWVRECVCQGCERPYFLFPYSFVTTASRSRDECWGYFGCSSCGVVKQQKLTMGKRRCPSCDAHLADADTSLLVGSNTQCPHCSIGMQVIDSITGEWHLSLVQRICKLNNGKTITHFGDPNSDDVTKAKHQYQSPPDSLTQEIPSGVETRILHRMGFQRWSDMYPNRQLHCLLETARIAQELGVAPNIRDRLLLAIVGAAEMAGHLSRWDRFHTKAFEAMANHRFSPIGLAVEVNLLSPRGRGTLPKRLGSSIKAAQWAKTKMGDDATSAILIETGPAPFQSSPASPVVVVGSSEQQLLPTNSVDLVLTDPPYFDSVQYGELSYLFYAWARATLAPAGNFEVNLHHEAVPNASRGVGLEEYSNILKGIFDESVRTLKPNGRLILTFHSTDIRAWYALVTSLGRLQIIGLAVCNSENETDHAKRGTRAFTKDLIIECQVGDGSYVSIMPTITSSAEGDQALELLNAGLAMAECGTRDFDEFKADFMGRANSLGIRRIR